MKYSRPVLLVSIGFLTGSLVTYLVLTHPLKMKTDPSNQSKQSTKHVAVPPQVALENVMPSIERNIVSVQKENKTVLVDESEPMRDGRLPAPQWHPESKPVLEQDANGKVYLRWIGLRKAKGYFVQLEDESGKKLKRLKTVRSFLFNDDHPLPLDDKSAVLYARISAIGSDSREGPLGDRKKIIIRSSHIVSRGGNSGTAQPESKASPDSLAAPQIEEIRIEQ